MTTDKNKLRFHASKFVHARRQTHLNLGDGLKHPGRESEVLYMNKKPRWFT